MNQKICVYNNRPDENRQPVEDSVYDLLEELNIEYIRADHKPLATIAECEQIDTVFGVRMCKNLFLCNLSRTEFYLLLMPGDKKFVTKVVSKQIGSSRLSFAPEEYMIEYLGVKPGAVTVMGLMNDNEHKVKLLIDEDLLKENYIGCHPCVNTSSIRITIDDMINKFLKYSGHYYTLISL